MSFNWKKVLSLVMALAMILSFVPTNFAHAEESETQVTAVAKVGDTEYATIDEAIAAWTSGTTLTLLDNVTLGEHIFVTGYRTLDLGTYTIYAPDNGDWAIEISSGSMLTVNADAANPGGISALNSYCIYYQNNSGSGNSPTVVINNGVFSGTIMSYTAGSSIYEINGGIFNTEINLYNADLRINGGSFNCNIYNVGSCQVSGGTFVTENAKTFATNYLAEGYVLGEDGKVVEETPAESTVIFTVGHVMASQDATTLEEAIALNEYFYETIGNVAILGAPVIKLEADYVFTAPVVVDSEYPVIIDLNGHSLIYNGTVQGEAMITNKGELTINDSVGGGEIYYNYTGAADSTYSKGNYTISNAGTLTVNGGKIHIANLSGHAKYPIDNNSTTGNAVLVINGGHLYNYNTSAIRQFCNSTTNTNSVTITGGLIEGYSAIWMQNPGSKTVNGALSITGGEIRTTAAAYVNGTADLKDVASKLYCTTEGGAWSEGSSVSITGGTINENVYLAEEAPATLTIGDATFNGNLELPAAPAPVYVAEVNGVQYETLEAAFAAAGEGDTITLLTDAAPVLTSQRAITKAAVINLNGKTLTLAEDDLYFGTTTFTNGKIVVDPSVKASTAVFWMFEGQTLTFNNVDIVATGVTGTYLIGINGGTGSAVKLLNGSKITIANTSKAGLTAVICDNGSGNSVVIDGCDIDVANVDGRFYLGGTNGSITVEDSTVDLNGVKEGFYLRAGQTLAINGTSVVNVVLNDTNGRYGINLSSDTATYTKADTATVNATDNLPEPVYVAYIGETGYESLADAVAAAQSGATILLKNGEYELPLFSGKELTFKGESKDGVIVNDAPDANTQGWLGSTFHFENLTAKGATANYHGLANGVVAVTYKDCNINGLRFLYAKDVSFEGCAFNAQGVEHSFWTYGASNITVTNCTFTYTDRAVNCYSENGADHETDIAFTGCTFTYAGTAAAPEGAVEINSGSSKSIDLTMNGCTAPAKGAMWFNSQWDSKKGQNTVVVVDGVTVWKPLKGTGTAEDPYLISSVEDLIAFRDKVDSQAQDGSTQYAGKYFKLTADLDLAGINWNPIGTMAGDHGSFKGIFDGDDHTIYNLNVQQAGNGLGLFARTAGNAEIKNLNLHNVTVKSTDNSNYVGGLVGNSYASTKITNVHVTGNIDISGRGYIGGISGHGYVVMDNVSVVGTGTIYSTFWCAGGILGYAGEGATNIMNAHVEGITITSAAGGLGAIVGMAEDNNGTQPISGSNLSAKNVEIKTYIGAYGDAYADYALGYLYGGNPTSKLTGNLSVENVNVKTSTGATPTIVDAVASVNGAVYFNLKSAINAGGEVKLLRDVTENITIADNATVVLDLNGKTLNGYIAPCKPASLTVKNGSIVNTNASYSAIEINAGELVLENVNVSSARHGVRIDGAVTATINGGEYKSTSTSGTRHAVNVSGAANVTIKAGTFVGPKGTAMDSGSAVCVQAGATVTIEGGNFSKGKNATLGVSGTMIVKGGTFDQNPSAHVADGYVAVEENGVWIVVRPIKVTYADGTVEYFSDMLEAIPYTTNYPKLEGATITLLADVSGAGIRFMENDMVFDLNGHTYTITAGTGSQGTNTSGFQIRPEVTTDVIFKNGTIKVAAGAPVVWMFNNYATDFIVENVTVDCTNMAWSYGKSCYVHVSRPGDNTQFIGNTKIINFNSDVAGAAINVGGTMTIADTVDVSGLTVELDAGATLTAPAGLDVVTADGYKVVYADGKYTSVSTVIQVSTKAELNDALAAAQEGDTILLTADIDYGTDHLKIEKPIILDLGSKTLTTRARNYGIALDNDDAVVTNGKLNHAGTVAAIKVWDAKEISDLEIDVTGTSATGSTIDGIVIQENAAGVDTIKNVTVHSTSGQGVDSGIKTYNCGNATEPVIGSMENVKVDAKSIGLNVSALVGTATGCTFKGGVNGVELWIKGTYSASLTLADCDVVGGVSVHDEFASNVTNNGTLSLTTDANTTGVTTETVTLTINHAEESQIEGEVLETIIANAQAKVNGTYYLTLDEAFKAAQPGDTVTILAGNYTTNLDVNQAITVVGETDANGNNLVNITGKLNITADGATVKNINVNNGGSTAGYINAKNVLVEGCTVVGGNGFRSCYTTGTVTFKDSTITGSTYGIHFDGSAGGEIVIDNCVITGWTSFASTIEKVTIKDSKFADGNYNVLRFYQDAEVTNTVFAAGMRIDSGNGGTGMEGVHMVFTGCSMADGSDLENCFPDSVIVASDITVDGVKLTYVAKIGNTYYKTIADAIKAAQDGETITLLWAEGDAPIAMNGYVSGKTVTITGTAQVDWEKGFLFVGRTNDGTTAGDATLIFKDAKLTTAQGGDHGIHVSGAEKGSATKANGTVKFINSTVNLSYLINKGTMTLDNSTLTVKSGFSIGGRPASETVSGADATATLTLKNGSKVVVDNHNGMGLGYEAIGVMNIDATSTFETTKSFLVTAKGTMNIAGTVKIAGTLTNNGSIVLTDVAATLTSSECGNVTTNIADHKVVFENGQYKVVPMVYVAQVGEKKYESLQAAINAATAGQTVKLLGNVTLDGSKTVTESQFGYETLVYVNGQTITIDFNGYTVEVTPNAPDANGGLAGTIEAVIFVGNGANLTLKDSVGNGGIKVNAGSDLYSLIYNAEATLTVENGVYNVAETVVTGSLIYGDEPQETTINGGSFTLGNASEDTSSTKPWIFNVEGKNVDFIDVLGGTYNQDLLMNYGSQKDCEVLIPRTLALKDNGDGTWTIVDAVAYVGNGEYNNGYATLDEAFAAAEDDDEVVIQVAGTYALSTSGKNITITGAVDGVVFDNIGAKNMGGANVTFNNVTFDYYPNVNYTGLQHSGNLVYKNCTFNGQVFLYGASETFNGCTFNQNSKDAYNVWTYGAKKVAFNECTFNSAGKSVLVYNEGGPATALTVTDCDFIASAPVDGKAAIEIDTTSPNNPGGMDGTTIVIDGETTATGFDDGSVSGETLWNDKKDQANLTVTVDGELVWPVANFVAQIGTQGYKTLDKAIDAAQPGDTIVFLADITEDVTVDTSLTINGADFKYTGTMTISKSIDLTVEKVNFVEGNIVKGKNTGTAGTYTIKNCNFSSADDAVYAVNLRGTGSIVIEDCTSTGYFGFLQVPSSNNTVSLKNVTIKDAGYAVKVDYSNGVTMENVKISDSTYGFVNSNFGTKTITVKDCTIDAKYPLVIWDRDKKLVNTFKFVGTNDFGSNAFYYQTVTEAEMVYTKYVLADENATLKAVAGLDVTTDVADYEVKYENGTYKLVAVKKLFDISFARMNLANALNMSFAFEAGHADDWTGAYVEIVKSYADGTTQTQTVEYADWSKTTINGVRHYYVTFNGISAKEMTDLVKVTVYNANGEAISNCWTDSVRAYAMRTLENPASSAEELTMIVDMLNYGAAAQTFFGYNEEDLANNLLTDAQKALATQTTSYEDTRIKGDNFLGSNLNLVSSIEMMVAFKNIDQSMHAVISYVDHYGETKEIEVDGAEFELNNGAYVIYVSSIVVADARQDVTVTVYDGETVVAYATDSVESYVARAMAGNSSDPLFEMIMKFADSAYAYLH